MEQVPTKEREKKSQRQVHLTKFLTRQKGKIAPRNVRTKSNVTVVYACLSKCRTGKCFVCVLGLVNPLPNMQQKTFENILTKIWKISMKNVTK